MKAPAYEPALEEGVRGDWETLGVTGKVKEG